MTNDIETMVSEFKDVEWNNLNQNERQALEKLRSKKSIVVKIADKGGAIVVMNRADYVHKIKKDLNNRKYYKKLDHNNIDNNINEKQLFINQIKDYFYFFFYLLFTDYLRFIKNMRIFL